MTSPTHGGSYIIGCTVLNAEFKSDLQWWNLLLNRWNGKSCLAVHISAPADREMETDASGPWGCGTICGDEWLQLAWIGDWPEQSITVKELGPIVLAIAVWGKAWARQCILAKCDNMAVVHVLRARTS